MTARLTDVPLHAHAVHAGPAVLAPAALVVAPAALRRAVQAGRAGRGRGARVGLLDCDIYGPSIPLMMGVNERPSVTEGDEKLVPLENHGIKLMSMGFLLQDDQPVIWRGPMIMRTIQQFISQVLWGELDYLLVDLPPGTGDISLSLASFLPTAEAFVVTTPNPAAPQPTHRHLNT